MLRSIVERPLYRRSLPALTLALPAACLLVISSISTALAQEVQVNERNGLVSVQASNASVIALAEELSSELGIRVVVTGDTQANVNIDIIDEPVNKALAKLSPNHMLVRANEQPDSEITEVVLMLDEGADSGVSGGGDDQFLPSGSPADDVIVTDEQPIDDGLPVDNPVDQLTADGAPLRDPNRSAAVRETADAAASDASGMPQGDLSQAPPPDSFDPVSGLPIDPVTGLPLE